MAQTLRVILLTGNAESAPELRRAATSLPSVRIVAELDEPSLIGQAFTQFPCDLIIADLDPSAPVVLECLRQLKEAAPQLPIFALSKCTEGDIVLKAMKAGVREFFVKPLNLEEFHEALEKLL
ncbi:MAG TPA: response regulator, partial [Phycisphaerae bacterium]|nr:response regulator [Phycisphaerae bacterium]